MSIDTNVEYTGNNPHNGAFVVYVNGIEIPVTAASVMYGAWRVPEATIITAADPVLTRLGAEDRLQLQIFFCDDFLPDQKPEFKLIFDGEIYAWAYTNTPTDRGIQFSAWAHINIFMSLYLQFLSNIDDFAGRVLDPSEGIAQVDFIHNSIVFPFSFFTQGLSGSEEGDETKTTFQVNRPFDFMYNLVKAMCSTDIPDKRKAVPAVNFLSRWARLTNFINRFAAVPTFDTVDIRVNEEGKPIVSTVFPILKSLQDTSALDTLVKVLLPQIQSAGSLWDMLQIAYQTMLMEIAMIPPMPLLDVKLETSEILQQTVTKPKVVKVTEDAINDFKTTGRFGYAGEQPGLVNKRAASIRPNPMQPKRIPSYFAKPQFIFGLPPACNVIFPSQIESITYNENYATQPTRLYFNDEVISRLLNPPGILHDAVIHALSSGWPPAVSSLNKERIDRRIKSTGKNYLLWPEEFYKGPVMDRRVMPSWLFFLKQRERKNQHDEEGTEGSKTDTPGEATSFIEATPDIYQIYAEYEYFRERYSRRAGAVILKHNPFIVPGFPAIIFDNRASRVDLFCYILTVQHQYQARGNQTTVNFAYGRTLQEMLELLKTDYAQGIPPIGVSPADPIDQVRDTIQDFDKADEFYRQLFFGNAGEPKHKAVGDWRDIVGYRKKDQSQEPVPIFMDMQRTQAENKKIVEDSKHLLSLARRDLSSAEERKVLIQTSYNAELARIKDLEVVTAHFSDAVPTADTPFKIRELTRSKTERDRLEVELDRVTEEVKDLVAKVLSLEAVIVNLSTSTKTVHNLDGSKELAPRAAFREAFRLYDVAMEYNWRPICSLDEYIIFHDSLGEHPIPAHGHTLSVGAVYYERIRRLRPPIPNQPPPDVSDGIPPVFKNKKDTVKEQEESAPLPTESIEGLGTDFPQTREDWDSILLTYRNNVYNSEIPGS